MSAEITRCRSLPPIGKQMAAIAAELGKRVEAPFGATRSATVLHFSKGRVGSDRFRGSVHNSRQADRERRAPSRIALNSDVAAHHLTEALADREAKPGAAVFTRRSGGSLGKLLEHR